MNLVPSIIPSLSTFWMLLMINFIFSLNFYYLQVHLVSKEKTVCQLPFKRTTIGLFPNTEKEKFIGFKNHLFFARSIHCFLCYFFLLHTFVTQLLLQLIKIIIFTAKRHAKVQFNWIKSTEKNEEGLFALFWMHTDSWK